MSDNPRCSACGHHNAILNSFCRDCGHDSRPERIDAEIAKLPTAFKLRGFPGEYFRPSRSASYVSDNGGVTIYLQKFFAERDWRDHSKGTLREILKELIEFSGDRKFSSDAQVEAYLAKFGEQPDQHLLDKLEES